MIFKKLKINDVILIKPKLLHDKRGYFYESFNNESFYDFSGKKLKFVQQNFSHSFRGVLRGLHYQSNPKQQGKLLTVTEGEIFDVALDIRKNSPTYSQYISVHLSSKNKNILWIPKGFAHGFLTISKSATISYLVTNNYSKNHEKIIKWNDPKYSIKWPKIKKIVSIKDNQHYTD
jgi:dTDP-4-dehydrorhamnose 3,5-epimerase